MVSSQVYNNWRIYINGIIYMAEFDNGKSYIGQTTQDFGDRKACHKYLAYNNLTNSIFHKAIRKYGWDSILWKILEDNIDSSLKLNNREEYWIDFYGTTIDKNGYNMTKGGDNYEYSFRFKEKELEDMIEDYKNGMSSIELGKKYNRQACVALNTIKRILPDWEKYSYHGRGSINSVEKEDYYKLYEDQKLGLTYIELSQKYKCSKRTVFRILHDYKSNLNQ